MKALTITTIATAISGSHALAATNATQPGWSGVLPTFFIAFAVLVFLFQLLPGITLFIGLLRGVFGSAAVRREVTVREPQKKAN